jgi:hypothetical protein
VVGDVLYLALYVGEYFAAFLAVFASAAAAKLAVIASIAAGSEPQPFNINIAGNKYFIFFNNIFFILFI